MSAKRFLVAVLCLVPFAASAQEKLASQTEFGARASAELDWKMTNALHLSIEEEARLYDMSFGKMYTTAALSYKFGRHLKVGAGYSYIGALDDDVWKSRHRGFADVTGSVRVGDFKISLRERFQATYKAYDINTFQKPQTAYALKSRLKVVYDIPHCAWAPYVSTELRTALNAVDYSSLGTTKQTAGTVSYSDVYCNRLRTVAGTEWRVNRKNYLDFYLLYDRDFARDIDATAEGRAKSYTVTPLNNISLGIAYRFAL